MPTSESRLRALTNCGLTPRTAQEIVSGTLELTNRERAAAWLYYSSQVPNWMKRLWDAQPISTTSA